MNKLDSWQRFYEAGNSAFCRGLYESALTDYLRALDIARKTCDQTSLTETLRGLTRTYFELGKVTEARESASEAKDLDRIFWGDESEQVANDNFLLAEALRLEGNLVEARTLLESVLSFRVKLLGDSHEETLAVFVRLIWISLEEGRYDGLLELTQHAFDVFARIDPPGMFGKALDIKSLLVPYMVQSRFLEAELIYERALQLLRTILGDRHPNIAEALSDYSEVMKKANKHLAAWHLQSRSEAMNEVYSLERQADKYVHSGDLSEAEILYRRLLVNLRKRIGSDGKPIVRVLTKYADVVEKLGRLVDAELLRRQAAQFSGYPQEEPDLLWWYPNSRWLFPEL